MLWTTLLAYAAVANALPSLNDAPAWLTKKLAKRQGAMTMLRFGCAQVVIDRLDPLVTPGLIPAPHQHQIVGGNGFNATMTTGDVSKTASCTTCAFSKDLSNYWTANLYFKSPKNGTFKRVKQLGAAYVHIILNIQNTANMPVTVASSATTSARRSMAAFSYTMSQLSRVKSKPSSQ